MNPDIKKERENATFSVEKLTNILDGGQQKTKRRREIGEFVVSALPDRSGCTCYCWHLKLNVMIVNMFINKREKMKLIQQCFYRC